jgi:hypothetical protein
MTEDHRVASATERARIARTGQPLKDGEVRLNGMIFCSVSIEFFSHLRCVINVRCCFNRTKSC